MDAGWNKCMVHGWSIEKTWIIKFPPRNFIYFINAVLYSVFPPSSSVYSVVIQCIDWVPLKFIRLQNQINPMPTNKIIMMYWLSLTLSFSVCVCIVCCDLRILCAQVQPNAIFNEMKEHNAHRTNEWAKSMNKCVRPCEWRWTMNIMKCYFNNIAFLISFVVAVWKISFFSPRLISIRSLFVCVQNMHSNVKMLSAFILFNFANSNNNQTKKPPQTTAMFKFRIAFHLSIKCIIINGSINSIVNARERNIVASIRELCNECIHFIHFT